MRHKAVTDFRVTSRPQRYSGRSPTPATFRHRYLSEWSYVIQKDFPEAQHLGMTRSCLICPYVSWLGRGGSTSVTGNF
jgi:hypothetical protein